jgi:ribonuclease P protein subunit RPR2
MNKRKSRKFEEKKIARERISILFKEADKVFNDNPERANRYVEKARKLGMKANISMGWWRRKYCKHCYCYWKQGDNVRTRINNGKIVYYCKSCKKYERFNL